MSVIRKVFVSNVILGLCLLFSGCAGTTAVTSASETVEIDKVMTTVYPALVRIYVISTEYQDGREIKRGGAGSGAIISPDGYVVTNHHVVGHATKIWCTLSSRERVDADLIGTDPLADIAVIKLRPESMRNPVTSFPYAKWGDSEALKVGDKVFALGSPGALAQSVTYGIVSNPSMVLPGRGMMQDGEPVGMLVRWIFHDAQIFNGNSGGPLVNVAGEIVGINELGAAQLGGAIPAHTAKNSVKELIDKGRVDRSWTGIDVQILLQSDTDLRGVLISSISKNSPGEKAGLKPGDKILKINNQDILVRFSEQMPEFHRMILNSPIGGNLEIVYLRDGKEATTTLTTVARGSVRSPQQELLSWGLTVREMTLFDLVSRKLKEPNGVMVATVRNGGPAGLAKPSLKSGDIITMVADKKVVSYEELLKATEEIVAGKEDSVETLVTFWRWGNEYKTVVEIGPEDTPKIIPQARKSWFPANVQVLTKPLAKVMGLEGTTGVRIVKLFPQLRDSEFKLGDIITKLNDEEVDVSEENQIERFNDAIRNLKPGETVDFTIIRESKEQTIAYKLTRAPKPNREMPLYKHDFLGFGVRQLSTNDKVHRDLPLDSKAVIVSQIESGGWAQLGGLGRHDIIETVNGEEVKTTKALEKILNQAEIDKVATLILFVRRGNGHHFVEIRPRWNN